MNNESNSISTTFIPGYMAVIYVTLRMFILPMRWKWINQWRYLLLYVQVFLDIISLELLFSLCYIL